MVSLTNRQRAVKISRHRVLGAAVRAVAAVGRPDRELHLTLVGDAEIRRLNARFRGVRRRTDVLAFPLDPPVLGQVVVSAESARRQARRLRVPIALELDLLVTHGVLHLVGYDDREPREARLMHEREREILRSGRPPVPDRLWTGLLSR
ncbi:MAG: rRNA maturation RNase YbeY [Candidatus Rokuibacteriota bacterium]|nr:MAG: rRNA maturation RNase YbeY [Candidatus Rokubacteria bacterium]